MFINSVTVLRVQFAYHGRSKCRNIKIWSECSPFPANYSTFLGRSMVDPYDSGSYRCSELCNPGHYHILSFSAKSVHQS